MKILDYKYSDGPQGGWDYAKVTLGKINLLVGESGSGKTKFLNTIFNIGSLITNSTSSRGHWQMLIEVEGIKYEWKYYNSDGTKITQESISIVKEDSIRLVIDRNETDFYFKQTLLPKLSKNISAISLLKEEEEIKPLFTGFNKIARRNFFSDELDKAAAISNIPNSLHKKVITKTEFSLLTGDLPVSARLFLMKQHFKNDFDELVSYFKSIFPNIESVDFPNLSTIHPEVSFENDGKIQVFSIKEKGVQQLVPISQLSSGMQKVLLLLTDIMTLPGDWIYLIDEYENSLGVNAINFLPDFLNLHGGNNQFIITTHHPYLINNMPIKDWYVFNRIGSNVNVIFGGVLEERLGKSKQQAFVKLINDPIYTGDY